MQLCRRHLAFGETDHELIWLSVSLLSLTSAAAWFAIGLPWPRCLFHDLTGLPCVTCGATRSAISFFHADFFAAWKWNPLVFVCLSALSIFDVYAAAALVIRGPRLRIVNFTRWEKTFLRVLFLTILGLNWIYLLSRWRNFS